MRGFAALPLIIILVIAGVVGVGWYTFSVKQQTKVTVSASPSPIVSPSPSPTPVPTQTPVVVPSPKASNVPLIDCLGPDGKHAQATKQDCDNLWKYWATPAPSPSPSPSQSSSQSSGCNTSTDLTNLIVNIQPKSGQSLVGDAAVTMSNGSGDCAGHDSRLPYIQIIRQGSTSITFPSFRPGKFHIQVGYHGNNYDSDVSLNSGDNSTTVTVSN